MNDHKDYDEDGFCGEDGECRHMGDGIAFAIFAEALECTVNLLELIGTEESAEHERSEVIAILPSCFSRSYDMSFFDRLAGYAESMIEDFENQRTLKINSTADEVIIHIVNNLIDRTDGWRMLNRKGKKRVMSEIGEFQDRVESDGQFTILFDEENHARAVADPKFILEYGLKNLHVDQWFEPYEKAA